MDSEDCIYIVACAHTCNNNDLRKRGYQFESETGTWNRLEGVKGKGKVSQLYFTQNTLKIKIEKIKRVWSWEGFFSGRLWIWKWILGDECVIKLHSIKVWNFQRIQIHTHTEFIVSQSSSKKSKTNKEEVGGNKEKRWYWCKLSTNVHPY